MEKNDTGEPKTAPREEWNEGRMEKGGIVFFVVGMHCYMFVA